MKLMKDRTDRWNGNPRLKPFVCAVLPLILNSICAPLAAGADTSGQVINPYKVNASTLRFLAENKQKQLEAARSWKVFHDFQFSDHYEESGIRFEHHCVDDAAKNWKPAHYDHGSGIAVAEQW